MMNLFGLDFPEPEKPQEDEDDEAPEDDLPFGDGE